MTNDDIKKWNDVHAVYYMWQDIYNLKEGWDGYVAKPIPQQNIDYAYALVEKLQIPYLDHPVVKPINDGGISIAWNQNNRECLITCHRVQETTFAMTAEQSFAMPRLEVDEFVAKAKLLLPKLIVTDSIKANLDHSSG